MTQAIFRTTLSRFLVLILTLASSYAIAQVNSADLHGIISDPSGAVVVNAEIVIQTVEQVNIKNADTAFTIGRSGQCLQSETVAIRAKN